MTRLSGKRALVTGGASGFGAGIAAKFIAEGAEVIIADINAQAGLSYAEELGAAFVEMDVSSNESVAAAAAGLLDLNILVNNAGIGHLPMPMTDLSEAEFDRLFEVNMKSVYLTARHFVAGMKKLAENNQDAAILNIASTAGVSPRPNLTWYNSSKGWMITATRSMAVELATSNIRVNALNPVAGETPLLATFMGGDTPENRARFLKTIPLGRFSTPQDLGNVACFLCSDEASMITGSAVEVDGGRCI